MTTLNDKKEKKMFRGRKQFSFAVPKQKANTRKTRRIPFQSVKNSTSSRSIKNKLLRKKKEPATVQQTIIVPAEKRAQSPGLFRSLKQDPQYVVEYLPSIFQHYQETEKKYLPNSHYLEEQKDITDQMRAILVDWLFDVHLKFRMERETLFLCVNIIDRYLSKKRISRKKLQLLGVVALFIASKFEEIYIPSVRDLESICAFTYSSDDILKMERRVLTALEYGLVIVTPHQLVPTMMICTKAIPGNNAKTNRILHDVASFISEVTLLHYDLLKYTPSQISASSIFIASRIVFGDQFTWDGVFKYYIGYQPQDIMDCINDIMKYVSKCFENNTKLTAVRRKYQDEDFSHAAERVKQNMNNVVMKNH